MAKRQAWTWKNVALPKSSEEELARAFQVDLFNAALACAPDDLQLLMELGNLYTLTGQVREGLSVDLKLVELRPQEPIFHYNLACSQSLLGEVDAAFVSLDRAIETGYNNLEYLQEDTDLENLRRDNRFVRVLERLARSKSQADETARGAKGG